MRHEEEKGFVLLRPLRHDDLNRTLVWMQDPEIYGPFLRREVPTAEGHRLWFEAARVDPQQCLFAIECEGIHVGNAGLKGIDQTNRSAELWLYMGEKASHGRGIATAATRLLLKHAFGPMDLHRVWLRVSVDNVAAQRVYSKAGFTREGTIQDSILRMGVSRDEARG